DKQRGSAKTHVSHGSISDRKLSTFEDMPAGRVEVGEDKTMARCLELRGKTTIVSDLPLEPDYVLISRDHTKKGKFYFRRNLKTGEETFFARQGAGEELEFSRIDQRILLKKDTRYVDGEWIQRVFFPDPNGTLELHDNFTEKLIDRRTPTIDIEETLDGNVRYFVRSQTLEDQGKRGLYAYDPSIRQFSDGPLLLPPEDQNITTLLFSDRPEDYGKLIGYWLGKDYEVPYWLDPELNAIQTSLNAQFPGLHVLISDMSLDRRRMVITVSAAHYPPVHFLLVDKSKLIPIGSSRPWVKPEQLGKRIFTSYTARDGLEIPTYLTLPPGYKKGDRTRGAIILPHGGPWVRDYNGYDESGWVQYFANRGFVVLQPQYRGSQGISHELWLAGDNEWGLKMQDDKDDGAKWLVDQGYVEADRIAIHGYSYGGFAAMAASVRPNSPYQCAIAGAGVSNIDRLANTWSRDRLRRLYQGRTISGMNPSDNTDKVNIPILIYHGNHDARVPLWHGTEFYNAIKNKSPKSELVIFDKMGHGRDLWQPGQVAEVLENVERFLSTTCGLGPITPDSESS
ncbi:MAG: prolyl oligopeptidase family serine peptidase, partial [Pseudomonadota bacterium]|nr:prolyl oligopeptidase family serine peptidase [Pseudomonadota bacterium]